MSLAVDRVRLGLRANWQQFALLVVINAFVGGMVGLERAVLPLLAEHDFLVSSRTAILSFIVTFGATKALANLFAGRMSDRIGRKRILVAGWLVGLPVPVLIMLAPSWSWVVVANVLLGVSWAIGVIAALTFASGVVVLGRMYETLPAGQFSTSQDRRVDRPSPVSASRTAP